MLGHCLALITCFLSSIAAFVSIPAAFYLPQPSVCPQRWLSFSGHQGVGGGPAPWTPSPPKGYSNKACQDTEKPSFELSARPRQGPRPEGQASGFLAWGGCSGRERGASWRPAWEAGKWKGRKLSPAENSPVPVRSSLRLQWVCPQRLPYDPISLFHCTGVFRNFRIGE